VDLLHEPVVVRGGSHKTHEGREGSIWHHHYQKCRSGSKSSRIEDFQRECAGENNLETIHGIVDCLHMLFTNDICKAEPDATLDDELADHAEIAANVGEFDDIRECKVFHNGLNDFTAKGCHWCASLPLCL